MANELSALVEVAGETADRLAITPAQSLHAAIAGRVFDAIGPGSLRARTVHDAVAGGVYAGLRAAVSGGSALTARVVRSAAGDVEMRPLGRSRPGRAVVSGMNGVIGDRLEELGSDLAVPMSVRARGRDVACERQSLRRAFPRGTGRIAVFVHGLGESEEWWCRRGRATGAGGRFGARLRADLGLTPVAVRYNSGLHVSENGRRLARLLERFDATWPCRVEEIVLIGHSMGGLVGRAACHAGCEAGVRWPARVRHLVTLGTPHHGAPLEKVLHVVAWALRVVPEGRAVAEILDRRSAGIRDLAWGNLRDEDWRGDDRSALLRDRRTAVPLLPGCTHTFITATVTRDPANPLGRVAGDLLVRTESAAGRCGERSIPVPPESVVHLGGLTHFDLLDHPLVYDRLREVLAAT